ncbi:MAG: carboxylate-amine ligase [Rhodospirillaceae bacterium]|nr:carboxylate-amine ligase [Rhodospirillaceae bacterium]
MGAAPRRRARGSAAPGRHPPRRRGPCAVTNGAPSFALGIEEEYLLVDRKTRDLAHDRPEAFMTTLEARLGDRVKREFLTSQVELTTAPCPDIAAARRELKELRRVANDVAAEFGLAIVAASTHPFAGWEGTTHTDRERYKILARDLQGVGRRLLICGLHVHCALDDDELRIDLMSQIAYFLPHILALSTSSPYWRGEDTGLQSYRIAVFDELPRTGIPEQFDSWGEYQRHVDILVRTGLIEDASKLWWDVRPSARFPTLEMRLPDVPTRIEDSLTIAALYVCLLRMLWRLKRANQRWRRYAAMLIGENRWRAQRYGIDEGLVDFGKGAIVPYGELLGEMIDLVREDAEVLGCVPEVARARDILADGTSAHRQRRCYAAARKAGADHRQALAAVVDALIAETAADL